ncbi:uncharacterized protein N7496_000902 [Penicillium cataractarum]|uniref:Mucin-7 n=1 Tax=Penicillium cataractarum TaxID=2100454 RepID=A0A9W9VVB4_9EURO|nr:uncharacterized protein N7496_000902 [Penicillium cataractarum]KAJ5389834.1 hypothetical protein N7496_000902 [Penicillium cataractarum]
MSDNNAHPGVRSLLAKFENSQSPITSPPSRGRSPVGSDTPGSTRPLSKVRASFVTVEGAIQSSPGSPLRKTSGRSDSPGIFGPKINAEEIESRRQNNVVSPTPGGHEKAQTSILDRVVGEGENQKAAMVTKDRKISGNREASALAESVAPTEAAPAKKEKPPSSAPTTADTEASPEKEKAAPKTVTKRPSNVHTAKHATTKPIPHTTVSTSSRTTNNNGSTKPTSAREVAKERANALAHKPSRPSLNPAAKTTTRMTRGSTPSADAHKTSTGNTNKPRSKSPTRPVRLPSSMTAQTQSSNAKHGSTGPATGRTEKPAATLTRKPSTLKSAAAPAGAVRRQPSRPSLPAQSGPERPSSRVSDIGARPVNEGFLARMMRPTASSASKTHEKTETKAPVKPTVSKAPRPSMGRAAERGLTQTKAKPAALKPQNEKSQAVSKEVSSKKEEVVLLQKNEESEKENIEEVATAIPEEPSFTETDDAIVEEPEPEVPSETGVEDVAEKPVEQAITEAESEASPEPIVKPAEPTATETAVEVSEDLVATNAPETSSAQEETTEDVEVPAEVSAHETTHESSEQENEPDVKEVEEVSAETATESNEEKVSLESLPEPEAPKEDVSEAIDEPIEPIITKDVTITEAKEAPSAESELPQQTETTASDSVDDAPEITEDVNEVQSSEKIQEPKESIPVVESAAPAKSDTVDIDFASLALS